MDSLALVIQTRPEIPAVYLFGSRSSGRARPDSDTDVAVLTRATDWPEIARRDHRWRRRLILDLMNAFATDRVDLVILNDAAPLLAHRILRDGRLLACPDPVARQRFTIAAIAEYLDTEPLRTQYLNAQRRQLQRNEERG